MTTPPIYSPTLKPVVGTAVNFAAQQTIIARIPSGTSTSNTIDMTDPILYGYTPVIIIIPDAWTTAKVSIQVSTNNNGNWGGLHTWTSGYYDTKNNAAPNDALIMDGYPLRGVPYFRIVSGTIATPVNQSATRLLQIILVTQ